jgi:protein involved in polysaccharide export with SLBB domain
MVRTNRVAAAILAATLLAVIAIAAYARLLPTEPPSADDVPPMPASGQASDALLNIIQPLDLLQIRAARTLEDQPIDWFYRVEPDGQVPLGPSYGRVNVNGLTWEQAERKITEHLKKFVDHPEVQVTLARRETPPQKPVLPRSPDKIAVWDILSISSVGALPTQPIEGLHLVEPSGQVALGPGYGRIDVNGLTYEQAEKKTVEHLKTLRLKPGYVVVLNRREEQPRETDIPKTAQKIRVGDQLSVDGFDGFGGFLPIHECHLVEPNGRVALGIPFGDVDVKGLTYEQAEKKVAEYLKLLLSNPKVQITLARRGGPWREAIVPKAPYKIGVWDVLHVRAIGTLIDQPIDGFFLVESTGTLALGPAYGRVQVKGMTIDEAETAITAKLREVLQKPEVQVTLARQAGQKELWRETTSPNAPYTIGAGMPLSINVSGTLLDVPLNGVFIVEPTGTVALAPPYGRAQVNGLTLEAAEKAIQKTLEEILQKPQVQVTFAGWQRENDPLLLERARAMERRLQLQNALKDYMARMEESARAEHAWEEKEHAQQEKEEKEELEKALRRGPVPEHYTPLGK